MANPLTTLAAVSLADLLAPSLRADPTVQALVAAVDAELQPLIADLDNAMLMHRLSSLPTRVLDLLATELDTDPYRQQYTDAQKRALIAQAIQVHRARGTSGVLPPVVEAIFGGDAVTEEWYEYGGPPYAFRVVTGADAAAPAVYAALTAAIRAVKNVRSYLERLIITVDGTTCPLYIGVACRVRVNCPVGMAGD